MLLLSCVCLVHAGGCLGGGLAPTMTSSSLSGQQQPGSVFGTTGSLGAAMGGGLGALGGGGGGAMFSSRECCYIVVLRRLMLLLYV